MFLVTIVKLEEQVHRDELPQTREETKQPHFLTSDITATEEVRSTGRQETM